MRATILVPILVLARVVVAQEPAHLAGTHALELSVGMLTAVRTTTDVVVGSATVRSDAAGTIGSLGYGYWVSDDWSVRVSVGAAGVDATVSAGGPSASVESAVVSAVLFGVRYQPRALAAGGRLWPYAALGVGPYFGQASSVRAGATTAIESRSQTALGARAVIGMDLTLGKRFTLGAAAGYRPVTAFSTPIGARTNYSSPEFSLSFGVRLGGGNR
jgi:Outer membrane protein beta-barrel domain